MSKVDRSTTTAFTNRQAVLDYLIAHPGARKAELIAAGVAQASAIDYRMSRMEEREEITCRDSQWFALVEKTAMRYVRTVLSEQQRSERIKAALIEKAAHALPPLLPEAQAHCRVVRMLDKPYRRPEGTNASRKNHIRVGGCPERKLHI